MINIHELQQRLLKLPNEAYQQDKKVLEAKEALEIEKINYDVNYSMALLKAQKANATEKRAEAIVETKEEKIKLLKASIAFEKANSILTAKNNEFIALRKVSSIEEALMKIGASGH